MKVKVAIVAVATVVAIVIAKAVKVAVVVNKAVKIKVMQIQFQINKNNKKIKQRKKLEISSINPSYLLLKNKILAKL